MLEKTEADWRAIAAAWLALDPDPDTRSETTALLEHGDLSGLRERFGTRLAFGTAGLRGPMGAGPNRMNQLLVRQTAAGLADHLVRHVTDARSRPVVIGFDARHKSDVFAYDSARVFAARGFRVVLFAEPVPTPVLAFSVLHLGAVAGVQVTASHNPPADNGYKVYWGDGAQIVPPLDDEIAACIAAIVDGGHTVELKPADDPLITFASEELVAAYLEGVAALDPGTCPREARAQFRVVYTPMHGVGGATMLRALTTAGFSDVVAVAEQFEPDPDFSTVAFPNPEEPGALDKAFAAAQTVSAQMIIANDPDADRLSVAVPDVSVLGGWRQLRGDEVGWLLADHLLRVTPADPEPRLLCTTIVSSSLLAAMAKAHGVEYVETLTGFKWLARAAMDRPGQRLVLAYEEALGYCVGSLVRDKDGISAAVVFADLAAGLTDSGSSLLTRLAEIEDRYGRHVTEQWSLRFDGPDSLEQMATLMRRLRPNLPMSLAGIWVERIDDLMAAEPSADVVTLRLTDGSRIVVRPSGTEPKCKVYFETVTRGDRVGPSIADLKRAMAAILGVAL